MYSLLKTWKYKIGFSLIFLNIVLKNQLNYYKDEFELTLIELIVIFSEYMYNFLINFI